MLERKFVTNCHLISGVEIVLDIDYQYQETYNFSNSNWLLVYCCSKLLRMINVHTAKTEIDYRSHHDVQRNGNP